MQFLLLIFVSIVLIATYLWFVNRSVSVAPIEATRLAQKPWTTEQLQEAYRKFEASPTDVTPYLFGKKNRRYVVVGGSGELDSC